MENKELEDALNQLDADTNALENLIEMLRRAALWSRENPDTDGLDWIYAIDMLKEAVGRIEVVASNITSPPGDDKNNEALAACLALRRGIANVKDLISIFDIAVINDATCGNPQLDWVVGFEVVFNMMGEIEKLNEDTWRACLRRPVSTSSAPGLTEQTGTNRKTESVVYNRERQPQEVRPRI